MFSYNTIINFTEPYKQEPNSTCAGLQFKVQHCVCFNIVYVSHGKSFSHFRSNFHFDEDRVVLLPESSLPLLRVGVLVVYQIENYFPNIELFYFLEFMPVVEMVRMFEDLLLSYLYRQKLSSQDGYQMRKIH